MSHSFHHGWRKFINTKVCPLVGEDFKIRYEMTKMSHSFHHRRRKSSNINVWNGWSEPFLPSWLEKISKYQGMQWLNWAIPSTMVRENSKISRHKVTKISHSFHHDWRKFWKHQGMIWQNEIFHGKETLKIRKIITLHPKSLPLQRNHYFFWKIRKIITAGHPGVSEVQFSK